MAMDKVGKIAFGLIIFGTCVLFSSLMSANHSNSDTASPCYIKDSRTNLFFLNPQLVSHVTPR